MAGEDAERRLYSKKIQVLLGNIRYIGATLSLSSENNPAFSHVAINLQCPGLAKGEFWIEADLMNQGSYPVLLCRTGYSGKTSEDEYSFTYDNNLVYGKEYRVRIELDGMSGVVRWLLDGAVIHETISGELVANG